MTNIKADIERAMQKKVIAALLESQKTLTLKALQMLQTDAEEVGQAYGSPIFTGRYAASHRVGAGTIDPSTAPENPDAPAWAPGIKVSPRVAAQSLSEARRILDTLQPFQSSYVSNNVEYAGPIERGHSPKAPPDGPYHAVGAWMRLNAPKLIARSLKRFK